jgi:hypothetical protein
MMMIMIINRSLLFVSQHQALWTRVAACNAEGDTLVSYKFGLHGGERPTHYYHTIIFLGERAAHMVGGRGRGDGALEHRGVDVVIKRGGVQSAVEHGASGRWYWSPLGVTGVARRAEAGRWARDG